MSNLIKGILSCALISIPEVTFMVILLIKFLDRKEFLDIYRIKENIKWYSMLIIPPAILMDILNYGIKINNKLISITICLSLIYIISIFVFKKTDHEEVKYLEFKIFISFAPIYISLIAIDLLTAPIWFKFLNLTYTQIFQDFHLVLLCSIPSRILELVAIIVILTKKNNTLQKNILYYICRNNFFKRSTIITMIFLLIFESFVLKLIAYNNLLDNLILLTSKIIFVIFFAYLVPAFIIVGLYMFINYTIIINNCVKQNSNSSYDEDDTLFNK